MPRGSSATKRQHGAANHRDTRHENGLVGPGKRVQKQKSNGQLNGHAKVAAAASPGTASNHVQNANTTSPPPPSLPETPPPAINGNVRHPLPADNPATSAVRSASVSWDSETSSAESYHGLSQENHRQIDVNAAKDPAVHRDLGPLGLAITVLRSCPLGDTIAILIVLLQIPPTFLSLIHLLFATLTFVPPSTAANSGLSFTDIFEGSFGTPSVATIIVIDLFVLMVWLFLWTPFQDVALDLAQTVIALTLGGGTSGKEAGMPNVVVCFAIIGSLNLFRNGKSGLGSFLRSSVNGLLGSPDPDDPFEPIIHISKRQNTHGWVRCILAIHILTQGVVRYIRDWYVRRERRDSTVQLGDPEAGKLADASNDSSTPSTQTPDNEPANSIPVNHQTITSKKKKKQSAQVRLRQPLWAALASTKIVMVKEYETSHTAAESAGTNATDINNLGNAPFDTESDRIWITYVGSDEVFFGTSYFPTHVPRQNQQCLEGSIDKAKPFYVRVNQTIWQPTRINVANEVESDPKSSSKETKWSGEIFGLAPMSTYQIDFISTSNGQTVFSTSVRTVQPRTASLAVGIPPSPAVTGRPGSPMSTLRASIATSESKLSEERGRLKRERKEQRNKLTSQRKELDKLISSITSGGGNEDRQKQKLHQYQSSMRQAEESLVALAEEIDNFEPIPTSESSQYAVEKREFQSQREQHKKLRKAMSEAKDEMDRVVQSLNSELSSMSQKQERMQSRIAKLNGEHERITDANARGLDEAQRKQREQETKEAERARIEMLYLERLQSLTAQVTETSANLHGLYATNSVLQQNEVFAQHQAVQEQTNSPTISNANLSATFGNTEVPPPENTFSPWNPNPNAPVYIGSGFHATSSPAGLRTRGRSSSMLSNVSGFTQSSGEGPLNSQSTPQHQPPNSISSLWVDPTTGDDYEGWNPRHESFGSGSGSGTGSGSSGSRSGAGSVGDPKSPIGNEDGKRR